MEDTEIIDLFWERKESAIQELSCKYSGYCYKIARNLLESHEDSEECLNDTWLSAWNYMPPKRPSRLAVFVGRITRGLAIDCFRKKHAAKRPDACRTDVCLEMDELSLSYTIEDQMAEQPQSAGGCERNCHQNRPDVAGAGGFVPLCGNHQ